MLRRVEVQRKLRRLVAVDLKLDRFKAANRSNCSSSTKAVSGWPRTCRIFRRGNFSVENCVRR